MERAATSGGAAAAGAAGALLAAVAALWLGRAAAAGWPGLEAVDPATGIGWLALALSCGLCVWASLVLTTAGILLMPGRSPVARWLRRIAGRVTPTSGRWVAGCLLAATGATLVPAAAQATASAPATLAAAAGVELGGGSPSGAGVLADPGAAAGGSTSGSLRVADPGTESPAAEELGAALPEPDWGTPTRWVPAPPAAGPAGEAGLVTGSGAEDDEASVVVHRGDTLWDVAARHLGPGAGDEEVAAAWPRWYEANRELLGDDPNLLLPGQVLRAPATAGVAR